MDNKKFSLRIISIILTFSLILTSLPISVAAETQSETEQPIVETTDTTKEQEATIIEEVEDKREPNVKHFLLSDGTYTAAVYDEDVHILEEDGTYSEIDNSLVDDGTELKAKNGKNDIKLSNNTNSSKLVKMKIGDYKISWNFEGINKTKSAKIKQKETKELTGDEKHLTITNNKGYAYFENAFDNVDLEYIVGTNSVKENIILKQKGAKSTYVVEYDIDHLTAVQTDSKTITLYDGENPVFTLSAPVMTDSAEQSSNDLTLTIIEQKNKKLTVQLSANEEWLNSDDRVYPVTLDPVAIFQLESTDITYKYTYSNSASTEGSAGGTLYVGYSNGGSCNQTMYSAVKLNELPDLSRGDMIYKAEFALRLNQYVYSSGGKTEINVDLYGINGDWSGFTSSKINVYGTGPAYYNTVIDYNKVSATKNKSTILWDITTLVKQWYKDDATNKGMVLRPSNHGTTADNMAKFASPANAEIEEDLARYPFFIIKYINHKGLEDYWSFTSQDLGTSGSSYVNNYTGNLVLNVPGIETLSASLPAGVSLYYNALQEGHFKNTNCGYGWKLNYDIKLSSITASPGLNNALRAAGYYYTIEDADGTVHYMHSESNSAGGTHKDEDGLGWTLVYSSTGDPYTLTDKENNKWTFNNRGRIIGIYNNQSYEKITFTYDSTGYILQKITDGAGHTLTFARNQYNSVLKITDDMGQSLSFGYSGAKLATLTYPDGEKITFTYNTIHLLNSVTLRDGRQVQYEYFVDGEDVNKYRIQKVTEYSMADTSGARTNGNYQIFSYGNGNFTTITDTDQKKMTYNFDTLGRPTSVMDETGSVSVNYESTSGTSAKNNKVSKGTTTIRPVDNLVNNSSFENGLTGWSAWNYDGVTRATSSAAAHFIGDKSICFSPTTTIVNSTLAQSYTPIRTGDYTFSFYYKTDGLTSSGGIKPIIALIDVEGTATYVHGTSATQDTNGEWERLSVTANVGSDIATIQGVIAYQNASGTVYIDCAQLEYGPAANEYNMITNSSFEKGETGWTRKNLSTSDAAVNASTYPSNKPSVLTKAFKFNGDASVNKSVWQTIPINLPSDQVAFSLSGYASGNSVPLSSGRYFGLDLRIDFEGGGSEYHVISFNQHNTGWQYASGIVVPRDNTKHIASVTLFLLYYQNRNSVAMSGINMYIDKTGAVYSYDDDGNVTSSADTANRKELVNYDDDNRITSYTDALGNSYHYTYNTDNATTGSTKYQVDEVVNSNDHTQTYYDYDSHGNVIRTSFTQEHADHFMVSNSQYSANGDRLLNTTDNLRTVTTYSYDTTNTNDLRVKSITKNGSTVNYTYKPNSTVVTGVSANVTGIDGTQRTVSNTYSYVKDRLTSITHNGFNYNLTYDLFGNRLATLVGNRTLMTNEYEPYNGNLIKSTYGNNDYTENVYDEYDRVTAVKQNGTTAYQYTYDAKSRINRLQDLVNNKTYNYTYDMIGRATTVDISDGSRIKYTYNPLDQTTKKYYKYNGTEKSVNYTYRSDGLPQNSSYSANFNSSYGYDLLNRPSSQTITTTNNSTITFERYYYTPTVNGTTYETNLVRELIYDDLQHAINYTYDANGNITSVYDSSTLGGTYYYSYEYDELGQLIRENNQYLDRTYTYTYDNGGNILTKTEYQFTEDSLEGQTHFTTTYTYGDAEWKDLLTAYDGYSITYDAIGNPLTYKYGEQLTWENGKQLANIVTEDGFLYTYKYDANGIRTQKSGDGEVIDFYLDGANIIGQKVNDNTMWFYYDNAGQRVALEYNGEVYYYVYNAQGDVVSLASKNGMPVVYYFYDAWGKLLGISGDLADTVGSANPFRYRGYYYDGETCFYYLNSRYYDPETGRFINADGFVSTGQDLTSTNMFVYCGNDPVNRSDPSGMFWEEIGNWFKEVGKKIESFFTPGNTYDYTVNGTAIATDVLTSSMTNAVKNSSRPTNIGKGIFAKQCAQELRTIEKFSNISSKSLKVASYGTAVIDVGIGVYENINNGATPKKTILDATVDTAFSVSSIWAAGAIGGAIGNAVGTVVPVAGNIVGTAAGFLVGVGIYALTDVITYNGKTARNWAKEGVNSLW